MLEFRQLEVRRKNACAKACDTAKAIATRGQRRHTKDVQSLDTRQDSKISYVSFLIFVN